MARQVQDIWLHAHLLSGGFALALADDVQQVYAQDAHYHRRTYRHRFL
jgi:hypothetical protein